MLMHKNIIHTYIYIVFIFYSRAYQTNFAKFVCVWCFKNFADLPQLATQQLLCLGLCLYHHAMQYIITYSLAQVPSYIQLAMLYIYLLLVFILGLQICVSLFMIKNQAFLFLLARKVLLWAQQLYVQCLLKGYLFRKSLSQEILFSLTNTHTITVSQSNNNEHYFC